MNRFFFRELLESNPKLLEEMIVFNRGAQRPTPAPEGLSEPLAAAVRRHPDLMRALARRSPALARGRGPVAPAPCWDFTDESRRLALMSAADLSRLGRLMSAAVWAEDWAKVLARGAVLEIRAAMGEDVYEYGLARGRWQAGAMRASLRALSGGGLLAERSIGLSRILLEEIRAGWPEALRARTAELFAATNLPAPTALPEISEADRKALWRFTRKIILRELDPECRRAFS